jgi:hypothetical protein
MSVIRTRQKDGSFKLSGFDMDLIDELSKTLNFKVILDFIDGSHPFGRVFSNGTATGAIGDVVSGRAQITIGRLYLTFYRLQVADSSISYFSFPEIFVVSPGKMLSDFEKLLQPFDSTVWLMLLAIFVTAISVTIFLNAKKLQKYQSFVYGSDIKYPLNSILVAALGGSHHKLPKRNFSRFLLMMFLVLCLVLRNAYQGSLYKFLQSEERKKTADTIDDIVEQEYEFYISPYQTDIFENQPKLLAR